MVRLLARQLRFWARSVWGVVLFLIISVAVVVQLGRAVFPLLNDYQVEFEEQLSKRLGVQVDVGHISAEWTGLRPRVTFAEVVVQNKTGERVFAVERVSAEVSLLSTFRDWRLGFRRVRFTGLEATVAQNDAGRWWVQGLQRQPAPALRKGKKTSRIKDPMDIFLFGRRVKLSETRLQLLFRSGLTTALAIPHIRLENDTDFHRLSASFAVDENPQALHLVVEGHGDPRDETNFTSSGYLQLQDFPSERVLALFGIGSDLLLSPAAQSDMLNRWRDDGRVNMALWFQGSSSRGLSLTGELEVLGSPLQPPPGVEWPQSLQSHLSGAWNPQQGWQLALGQTRLVWQEFQAPALDLVLSGRLGGETELAVASVDVAVWTEVVRRAGVVKGGAADALSTLRPRGELQNVRVSRRSREDGFFWLRANIRDGGADAWQGAPALNGINGYVEASAWGGEVRLRTSSGFSLDFPRLYRQPLVFGHADGSVRWEIDLAKDQVGVSSSTVHLANEEVAATGHFNLRLPLHEREADEPEMTLIIGAEKGAASLHRQLIPYTVPEPLQTWLDRAVQGGELRNAGFIYHGSLLKEPKTARVIQLKTEVIGGEVAFDSQWPALRDASGNVYLNDEDLSITSLRGRLGEVSVSADVELVRLGEGQRGVRIFGEVASDSRQAVALLSETPLRSLGGAEVASWEWQGPLTGQVDLLVPFDLKSSAAYQKVELRFAGNELRMPNLNLTFAEVTGPLIYDSKQGISSSGIEAALWGQPVRAVLQTEQTDDVQELVADLTGNLSIADVQQWSGRQELSFASGSSHVAGELRVPLSRGGAVRLALESSLEGVTLAAPPPLAKPPEQPLPLRVQLETAGEGDVAQQLFRFTLQDIAELLIVNQGGKIRAVDLAFDRHAAVPAEDQFRIGGRVARLDALQWRDALAAYLGEPDLSAGSTTAGAAGLGNSASPATETPPGLPIRLDLQIDQLHIRDMLLENLTVRGGQQGETWQVALEHPMVAGTVSWLPAGEPMRIDLARLYLANPSTEPTVAAGAGEAVLEQAADLAEEHTVPVPKRDFWDTLDLSAIPAMDVQIQDLRNGEARLGSWSMKVRPIEKGLLAYDLKATTAGLTISGRGKPGAELVWLRTPAGDSSYFYGRVKGRNLADTFRDLQLEPALTSEKASVAVDLQWADVPPRVTLAKLAGVVDLSVERGVFSRGGAVGDNPLIKLIGLLNFDTLARRLRLDFSDLSSTGLAYEKIHGSMLFRTGIIEIREPLQVETPSSHLQLAGELDVVEETLDTQLVATLPLAGNLTVAAALTGGVPLAIGVYVAGKVFKDQVARVSSLRYDVSGSWDDPDAKLAKIFENTVAEPNPKSK